MSNSERPTDTSWLACSSFVPPSKDQQVQLKNDDGPEPRTKPKKRKHKESKTKEKAIIVEPDPELFEIDIPQVQLTKPAPSRVPVQVKKADVKSDDTKKKRKRKKRKLKTNDSRYFGGSNEDESFQKGVMDISEFTERTKEFNIALRESPTNVQTWVKYIDLQDKGQGTRKGITQKKLAILDKALACNSQCDRLLNLKMTLLSQIYGFEKIASEARSLASRHPSSKVGWRWSVNSILYNLSRMTAPGLIKAYSEMLEGVTRRGQNTEVVLDVLLECGTFLRQAGLWEMLMALVEQYLEICFSETGSGIFKVVVEQAEKEIEKLEDAVITSGLPLQALWLRTEHLRSSVHFLPVDDLSTTEDPQRVVLADDVAPLVLPIPPKYTSKLVSIVLTLVKVPPLPCTSAFIKYLGLGDLPWHLESSEYLLTSFFNSGVCRYDAFNLEELKELAVSPQYVKEKTGSAEFLSAVSKIFDLVVTHCDGDKMLFMIWQIRWWRYLIKNKCPSVAPKQYLSKAKSMLKAHRDLVPLYLEYALLEDDCGNVQAAIKVLETAIELRRPPLLLDSDEKNSLYALYRTYVEMLIRNNSPNMRDKILRALTALTYGEGLSKIDQTISEDLSQKALARFNSITQEIIREMTVIDPDDREENDQADETISLNTIILGVTNVHWIACHAWMHWLLHGCVTGAIVEAIGKVKDPTVLELLWQLKLDVMNVSKQSKPAEFKLLLDAVSEAVVLFPDNAEFSHLIASLTINGLTWSKISSSIISAGSPIGVIFSALIMKRRAFDGVSEQNKVGGAVEKMYAQLSRIASESKYERCPLLWRLIIQYVSSLLDEEVTVSEFYKATEKCPWVKVIYYEAGSQLARLLPEVQDLLVEKELRLHITPEELDILRQDGDIGGGPVVMSDADDGASEAVGKSQSEVSSEGGHASTALIEE